MSGISGKGSAAEKFDAVVGKRASLLTETEQKARGIMRAIADAETAAARCMAAAKAQAGKAEEYREQVAALRADLDTLAELDE